MSVQGTSWLPTICRCVALVAVLLAGAVRADGPRPPNIVFFLCDDLGAGDIAALGSRDIRTPEIDRLFARGARLTRHWSGNAVCAPSRCVLMTGMHPGHAVVRSNRAAKPEGQAPMPAGTVTLARLLRDAGYATGGFGKWGLGPPGSASDPQASGFDRFYGYNCQKQAHSFYPDHLWDDRQRVDLDGRTYSADLIAERQLAFIRENVGRPFFLYVPTTVPHLALQVPADEPSLAEYRTRFGDEKPYVGGAGYVPCERPLATYAAMVTRMDREVGRIVRLLDALKLTDDTIFVFTSDNGATAPGTGGIDTARLDSHRGSRDWKGSPYEGGLRVPTVAVWPGRIPSGVAIDAPTGFEDWLPTLLDLAGLHDRIPAGIDGVSLAESLLGKARPPARVLYRELTERQWQTAVDGRWKVVRRGRAKRLADEPHATELYDLTADPAESQDVAGDHPEVVGRMEALLDREHVPHPDWPMPFADAASRKAGRAAAAEKLPARASLRQGELKVRDEKLLGTQNLYEHSTHPPAVIAGPGVPAGRRSDALCYLHDLTATVGDLAGVSAPEKSEGKSLVPVLRDQQQGIRDELLLAYRNVQRALVTPTWKLIAYPEAQEIQLFDLARDPDEIVNLADDPAADDPPPVEKPAAKPPGTAAAPSAAAPPAGGRPNIVLIMADDFGYECVGANGGQSYRTPHLDRLAATGARFEQCHVLPLCTPTRVELMTGRSNVRNYVTFGQLPRSETTFAHLLKQAGYATGICGKWQLGREPDSPRHFGFDESYLWQHTRRPPRYANPGLEINGMERDFRDGEYGPALVNDFAIDFVTRHKEHPFLLYYPMMLTHDPFQPTPDSDAWDPTARGEGLDRPVHFAAMVEYMDMLIGRLVTRLDELGIRDNTLLVFLGDNGTAPAITSRCRGADYRGGKGSTTMRGTHVPLVVNWPARGRSGLVTADLVGAVDVLPTLCEAAGVAVPDSADGVSFLPQVRGERGTPRSWIYSWYSPRLGAAWKVREYAFDQRFKLYRTGEFFDLAADPDERRPLPIESRPPQAAEAARTLSGALDHFAAARPPGLDRADRASARSPEPKDE